MLETSHQVMGAGFTLLQDTLCYNTSHIFTGAEPALSLSKGHTLLEAHIARAIS
jgi:hypothetical protein